MTGPATTKPEMTGPAIVRAPGRERSSANRSKLPGKIRMTPPAGMTPPVGMTTPVPAVIVPEMKFLHAADIHLDSPLAGLNRRSDMPDAVIGHCTRRAFAAMIDLALAEDVAFVIIAGDLYDGDWRDFSTGLFFAEQMQRLGRPCFLLRGNHDARSVITRNLTPPGNVREFSSRACETIELPGLRVALHGRSFPDRAVTEDFSAAYRQPVPGMLNIGVLHTSADDPGEHETYAPCRVADLALKGYDYWALGHIHARRVLSERPWIVFPGNPQGRHPKEPGPKGCTLVTV